MVICMDMESGAVSYSEPIEAAESPYSDEVLDANCVPAELALGLQEIPVSGHESHVCPTDAEAFLSAVYRFQE